MCVCFSLISLFDKALQQGGSPLPTIVLQYKPLLKIAETFGLLAIIDSFAGMFDFAKESVEDHLKTYQVGLNKLYATRTVDNVLTIKRNSYEIRMPSFFSQITCEILWTNI